MTPGSNEGFRPIAALAAAAFPGAGHLVLGQPMRALGAAAGVLLLFGGGLFIGGIDAIDSKEDRVWFYGQALVGPITFGVDWAHQNHFKAIDTRTKQLRTGYPTETQTTDDTGQRVWRPLTADEAAAGMGPPNVKGVGRMNELGQLSCTLAGMMNLIIILDALFPATRRRESGGAS
ncbi:MAG: hypothetical protein DHS20C14_17680 [Phycisphaeraceae bacterium]|nr:MAG: hypothetical protein DHS20C14_17680 [Phycisphaeraceae bacterium]